MSILNVVIFQHWITFIIPYIVCYPLQNLIKKYG